MPSIADYMTPGPELIEPHEPLPRALKVMREHEIRHLPVTEHGKLVGVLSKRDVGLVTTLAHAPPDAITVEDAMSEHPYTVTPDTPLNEVARVMAERKLGSAVIVDRGEVVGVFTTVDALNALADALEGKHARRAYDAVPTTPPRTVRGRGRVGARARRDRPE